MKTTFLKQGARGDVLGLNATLSSPNRRALLGNSDSKGRRALCLAASGGHHRAVKLLLGARAPINATDSAGDTALLAAVRRGHARVVSLLLSHHADVSVRNSQGETAICLAAAGRCPQTLQALLREPGILTGSSALSRDGLPPLACAIVAARPLNVAYLIAAGARTDASMLCLAARRSNAVVVETLLAAGADPNARDHHGIPALHYAISRSDPDLVGALLARGAHVDARCRFGLTPLMMAARLGDRVLVARLLDEGAKPNLADISGMTALMHAAAGGSKTVIQNLLARRADPIASDRAGRTPVLHALQNAHFHLCAPLIRTERRARHRGRAASVPACPCFDLSW